MRVQAALLKNNVDQLVNLLFPPRCLGCDAQVDRHGTLCSACWQQVNFITEPFCAACGLPFEYSIGAQAHCAACIQEAPPFARARAAFRYDDASKHLVLRLKYQDETALAQVYAPWLARAGAEVLAASDVIVPVPLHYWRFVHRRYNQSALLASVMAKVSGKLLLPDGLMRIRPTLQQTGLTHAQRQKNVRGAFRVHPKRREMLRGKTVLLVDDVYTTGATLSACAKALKRGGASEVNVLTLARRC